MTIKRRTLTGMHHHSTSASSSSNSQIRQPSVAHAKIHPNKLNLSQTILGQDYDVGEADEAHDALYDSKLLMRVLDKYTSAYSQRLDIMVDTHMKDAEDIRRSVKDHLSTAKSRRKRLEQTEFYTFFGWED